MQELYLRQCIAKHKQRLPQLVPKIGVTCPVVLDLDVGRVVLQPPQRPQQVLGLELAHVTKLGNFDDCVGINPELMTKLLHRQRTFAPNPRSSEAAQAGLVHDRQPSAKKFWPDKFIGAAQIWATFARELTGKSERPKNLSGYEKFLWAREIS